MYRGSLRGHLRLTLESGQRDQHDWPFFDHVNKDPGQTHDLLACSNNFVEVGHVREHLFGNLTIGRGGRLAKVERTCTACSAWPVNSANYRTSTFRLHIGRSDQVPRSVAKSSAPRNTSRKRRAEARRSHATQAARRCDSGARRCAADPCMLGKNGAGRPRRNGPR
jgi:hypothetical protein